MSGGGATEGPFPESQCHRCAYVHLVSTKRGNAYLMCEEPSMPRYPPQPMVDCPVFRDARRNA